LLELAAKRIQRFLRSAAGAGWCRPVPVPLTDRKKRCKIYFYFLFTKNKKYSCINLFLTL
jgi:hypothetical protein